MKIAPLSTRELPRPQAPKASPTPSKSQSLGDRFEPSPQAQAALRSRGVMDVGTAASTTLFADKSTFDRIASESTYGDTKWEELGVDEDKEWVVINGQRFEHRFSPEEKAARKASQKTLMDYMDEELKKQEEKKEQVKEHRLKFDGQGNFSDSNNSQDPKIEALHSNPKVMELLQKISQGGEISLWS